MGFLTCELPYKHLKPLLSLSRPNCFIISVIECRYARNASNNEAGLHVVLHLHESRCDVETKFREDFRRSFHPNIFRNLYENTTAVLRNLPVGD
uniref:Arp2/3 complex 34 kDa subunit n=1 Tax=Steinernema glaseri TaxID=37863 RepID=A0A1I7XWU0_9BILA